MSYGQMLPFVITLFCVSKNHICIRSKLRVSYFFFPCYFIRLIELASSGVKLESNITHHRRRLFSMWMLLLWLVLSAVLCVYWADQSYLYQILAQIRCAITHTDRAIRCLVIVIVMAISDLSGSIPPHTASNSHTNTQHNSQRTNKTCIITIQTALVPYTCVILLFFIVR